MRSRVRDSSRSSLSLVLVGLAATGCSLPHASAPVADGASADRSDIVTADREGSVGPDVIDDVAMDSPDVVEPIDVRSMDVADSGVEPTVEAGADVRDAGIDTGVITDTGVIVDSGVITDTGVIVDSGVITDTGVIVDSGVIADGGLRPVRCADIPMALRGSEVHTLYYRPMLDRTWQARCDFTTMGGPWTLIAKVDPSQMPWEYNNNRWTDGSVHNEGSTDNTRASAKFRGFSELSFTGMRLDFQTSESGTDFGPWVNRSITFSYDSGTRALNDVLNGADNQLIAGTTRANWTALIPTVAAIFDVQLQPNCNRIAFNAVGGGGGGALKVRIGILGNNEMNCDSCDSWIGVGGNPPTVVGATQVAGNRNNGTSGIDPDFRRTPSWVFIWVR